MSEIPSANCVFGFVFIAARSVVEGTVDATVSEKMVRLVNVVIKIDQKQN